MKERKIFYKKKLPVKKITVRQFFCEKQFLLEKTTGKEKWQWEKVSVKKE